MSDSVTVGLGLLAVVIPLVQHLRFQKKYVGYKSIQSAIKEKTGLLESLTQELVIGEATVKKYASTARDEQEKTSVALEQRSDAEAALGKLQTALVLAEKSAQQARSDSAIAKNECIGIKAELQGYQNQRNTLLRNVEELSEQKKLLEARIAHLLSLEAREATIRIDLDTLATKWEREQTQFRHNEQELSIQLRTLEAKLGSARDTLTGLMERIDLYSRVDEYTKVGHFEMPEYLYETSIRYQSEIKEVRDLQRKLIREKNAVTYPVDLELGLNRTLDKKILDGQVQLMLNAFNVECDLLIEKVNPANLDRTLEQIEKKAEVLEKNCMTLRCGFNIDYVELKFEECKLQFEFTLKKKEEQEEQRAIREQMREEVRVQKQYEDAVKDAEREELKLTRLLEKAREHMAQETELERSLSLAKISLLEEQLVEARQRGVRAKSMAEQTRRGFVYVISNLGAFGEGVFKIGLTRRLDPQERVDELSSASVPFPYDVHAICYSDDAPALEYALHKRFSDRRVNAVNHRKEFFRVKLEDIQAALEEIVDDSVEFTMTAKAEDYFQTKRLLAA
ncbi:DUF4041 domain-containing protein [Duganella sp. FT50W]|uniref:DUF4041 domain-containing protein n=1 Tax=Duganella lactea TaxID=2692173 RepID=A0A6L8MSM9_9BURK|nr:DUF4041 domain-containing protein [Duganella lactea]MYM85091.1 DUF4041 domain-containing protein [Duganella lactea]